MNKHDEKLQVWQRGIAIPGYDPALWRRDNDGNAICFTAYGDRESVYGWECGRAEPAGGGAAGEAAVRRPVHCGTSRSDT